MYEVCDVYTLHYITLHYVTLHYITLRYVTLRYITLHYVTFTIAFFSCRPSRPRPGPGHPATRPPGHPPTRPPGLSSTRQPGHQASQRQPSRPAKPCFPCDAKTSCRVLRYSLLLLAQKPCFPLLLRYSLFLCTHRQTCCNVTGSKFARAR